MEAKLFIKMMTELKKDQEMDIRQIHKYHELIKELEENINTRSLILNALEKL